MTANTSTVLTQEVPYRWEELKSLALTPRSDSVSTPIATQHAENSTPAPELKQAVSVPDSARRDQRAPDHLDNAPLSEAGKEALIAAVSKKVGEQLFEEIDLVVELALKKTRAHLKTDIQKALRAR